MKYFNLLFLSLVVLLASCSKDSDNSNPQTSSDILASTTWKSEGFYAGGQKTTAAVPNVQLKFNQSFPAQTININGNLTAPATWTLSADGTILTISYPNGYAEGVITANSQNVNVRVSATELAFINSTSEPITIFGIISLPANYELRFIPQSADPSTPAANTSTDLTRGTWTGSGTDAGIYNANTQVKVSDANITFKFRTVFGVNTLTVGGVPTPTTWSLNEAKDKLTLFIPSTSGVQERVLNIKTLTASSLIFTTDTDFSLYGIVTINTTNELRMIQQ